MPDSNPSPGFGPDLAEVFGPAHSDGGPELVQLLTPEGERVHHPEFDLDFSAEQIRGFYRDMVLTRRIDTEATALQRHGELGIWAQLLGQEAAQIGAGRALRPQDYVFPTYREHGVAWCKGIDPLKLLGPFRGVDHGSWDPHEFNFGLYTIVIGAQCLHATGYAMGMQRDGVVGTGDPDRDAAVIAHFGDGASSQGDVNESFIFAASYNAPVVFFCQNNQWAISEPIERQTRIPLYQRALGFGFPGIRVDGKELKRLSDDFGKRLGGLEEEIHRMVGHEFNIGSPKQLGQVLFDGLGLPGGKKGKTGAYGTGAEVLEALIDHGHDLPARVLDWRQVAKLKSTYSDALMEQINPATGRVHTSYSQAGVSTGRLASSDPNLQNIPIRTEIGRQIREAFVAQDGNALLAADYSQIELRLAAHMADVPSLKEAFANGEDIHSRTASEMFGEVNRDTRARAKTINFAILYGISRWGLAGRLGVEADEAQAMIDTYFQRFPGIQKYIVRTLEQVRECGYSETLFGRKTWFPRIGSKNQAERQGSERAAINAPIQGTSADIIKRAMVRMMPALEAAGLAHVQMLLQVHDELVFELPESDVDAARKVIENVMVSAAEPSVKLDVPLGVDIGTGTSWGAAH